MGQRVVRALVSQRSQLPLCCLRGHPGRKAERRIHRFQQRLVEQLGVQAGHPHVLTFEFLAQDTQRIPGAIRADVGGPGQPAHRLVVLGRGQQMGPEQALQLQAVFKQSQELIRGGQVRRIVASDVAAGAQCGQGVHRRGDVQGRVGASVNQLQ